jgi:sugar lactone lactonase YvrE
MRHDKFEVVHDEAMQVGECPLWHPVESALYWVDIDGRAVHRLHPASGKYTRWNMDTEPSALAIDADNGMVVALRSGIVHLNTTDGSLTPIAPAPYDQAIVRFNDGRVDPAGRFWIGTLYEPRTEARAEMYVLERGKLRRAWAGGMTVSNGLAFSPDGKIMYHADTTSHRIDSYDYDTGTGIHSHLRHLQRFATDKQAPGYGGRPDGAAVDRDGCYWVAMFEGSRILRLSPAGEILSELAVPVRCPTSLCFGGPGLHTLYITSATHKRPAEELARLPLSGKVLALRVDVAGRPEHAYRP